jgi:pilus assembly protein Flp/PilA
MNEVFKEMNIMDRVVKFLKDEDGAFAVEYALIAVLIGVAVIGGAPTLSASLGGIFRYVDTKVAESIPKII